MFIACISETSIYWTRSLIGCCFLLYYGFHYYLMILINDNFNVLKWQYRHIYIKPLNWSHILNFIYLMNSIWFIDKDEQKSMPLDNHTMTLIIYLISFTAYFIVSIIIFKGLHNYQKLSYYSIKSYVMRIEKGKIWAWKKRHEWRHERCMKLGSDKNSAYTFSTVKPCLRSEIQYPEIKKVNCFMT